MTSPPPATCAVECRNTLGEGCVVDPRDGAVYWTDIEEKAIWRLAPDGAARSFPLPDRAAFILPRRRPGFVIGFADRIALASPDLARFETVRAVEPDLLQTRVNDAAVSPDGGVVFGTFDERDRRPVAALYHLSPGGDLRVLVEGVAISNGLAFSPDGDLLYFADTAEGTVRRFAVGRDLARFDEIAPLCGPDVAPGRPDGATVDAEGRYWNARVWGGAVACITPEGRLDRLVDLPASGPTCVALRSGPVADLFVTTLRTRQTEEQLRATPLAGGLFRVATDATGLPGRVADL